MQRPPPPAGPPRAAGRGSVLDESLERPPTERVAKFAKRLGLDLADPLAGHGEALAHFLQRMLTLLADAEAQAEDLLFLGRQRAERALDLIRQVLADQRFVGRLRALVLEEVSQLRILADGRLEGERLAGGLEDEPDLAGRHPRLPRQLLGGGLPSHLVDEHAVDTRDAVQCLDHVHGNANRAGVVGDGPGNGLTDPPRRIRRELESPPVLEAVHRLHEPDIALLDEVEQSQLAPEISLRHGHDEAQVGLHELTLGLAHYAIVLFDFAQGRLERLLAETDGRLELSHLLRGLCFADGDDPTAELREHLLDEGRLQRQLFHRPLDGHTVLSDPLVIVGACGLAAALVCQRQLQPLDLALEASDASKGREERLDLLGFGLPAFGQQDDLVEVDLPVADLVDEGEQLARDHGNAREGPTELDLTYFYAPAQAHFLLGRQQVHLADLLEIEANWILSWARAWTERIGRECGGFLEDDGLFFLLEINPRRLGLNLGQCTLAQP